MSHERHNIVGAETVGSVEGNMCGTVTRGADVCVPKTLSGLMT